MLPSSDSSDHSDLDNSNRQSSHQNIVRRRPNPSIYDATSIISESDNINIANEIHESSNFIHSVASAHHDQSLYETNHSQNSVSEDEFSDNYENVDTFFNNDLNDELGENDFLDDFIISPEERSDNFQQLSMAPTILVDGNAEKFQNSLLSESFMYTIFFFRTPSMASGIGASEFDTRLSISNSRYQLNDGSSNCESTELFGSSLPDDVLKLFNVEKKLALQTLGMADASLSIGKVIEISHSSTMLTDFDLAGKTITEAIHSEGFCKKIIWDYQRFLTTFVDENGRSVYHSRIKEMCATNGESLEVSYLHLVESSPFLAKVLANQPVAILPILEDTTMRIVLRLFEEYDRIRASVYVRITDFPQIEALRDLRHGHLNTLVRVKGVVTRRSGVFPQLTLVRYDCGKCGGVLGPFIIDLNVNTCNNSSGNFTGVVRICRFCQSKGPFSINTSLTIYRNYQRMTLQESPGSVPAGRLPRHREIILTNDLIDSARPGELVDITGIYRNSYSYSLNNKSGFPVFSTIIEANHVQTTFTTDSTSASDKSGFKTFAGKANDGLTEEDIVEVCNLAKDPQIASRIFSSMAPSIYGHHDIKTALALALFGGQPKNVQGKHSIRGDINVLLLGDPGTAKSQFLKFAEKISPRAVFTTGQGASAVGLTASVRKDPITKEWTLEGMLLIFYQFLRWCIGIGRQRRLLY